MFKAKKINVGDLVAIVGQVDKPSVTIGLRYIDDLNEYQKANLYRVVSIDNDSYTIESEASKKSKNMHFDNLILVKENRPRPSADKLKI